MFVPLVLCTAGWLPRDHCLLAVWYACCHEQLDLVQNNVCVIAFLVRYKNHII